jgi:hypothetical protein
MKKIKDSEVKRAILDRFHMVMFMSINPNETINDFKARGREMVVESFNNLHFWAYYCQLGKQRVPLSCMAQFKTFLLWMHYMDTCSLFTHI